MIRRNIGTDATTTEATPSNFHYRNSGLSRSVPVPTDTLRSRSDVRLDYGNVLS